MTTVIERIAASDVLTGSPCERHRYVALNEFGCTKPSIELTEPLTARSRITEVVFQLEQMPLQ